MTLLWKISFGRVDTAYSYIAFKKMKMVDKLKYTEKVWIKFQDAYVK